MHTIESLISDHEGDPEGPRAIRHIEREIRDLLTGDAVGERGTAGKLKKLHDEAAPFTPATRDTGLSATPVRILEGPGGALEIYIELQVVTQDKDKRSEDLVAAHPAVAGALFGKRTQEELISALERADAAAHWKLADAVGSALHAAYANALDIYGHHDSPVPPSTFRLEQHNRTLAHNIRCAYETLADSLDQ